MEQSLKWFSDSTVGILDTEHDLKINYTALFRIKSANKYKGVKYCFLFYYFTFDYSIEMDQNNFAIINNP